MSCNEITLLNFSGYQRIICRSNLSCTSDIVYVDKVALVSTLNTCALYYSHLRPCSVLDITKFQRDVNSVGIISLRYTVNVV
jgi:hypothetical protein